MIAYRYVPVSTKILKKIFSKYRNSKDFSFATAINAVYYVKDGDVRVDLDYIFKRFYPDVKVRNPYEEI